VSVLAELALVVGAAVGVAISLALLPTRPTRSWRRVPVPPPPRPEQLVRLERLVSIAGSSAIDVHAYLRPLLAEIASRRLAGRGHVLERMPDPVGRELLGDRLWEIVRPDRPLPEDRYAPGIAPQELSAMLTSLERL